ncbi:AraC family transcriptional regulator, partial [Massilia arenosa]
MSQRRRLRRVLDYMEQHLDGPITLAALAEQACLSKFHFERFYCESLGETPLATVRRLRLARGRALLLAGDSVWAASLCCGYGSPQTFARAFQREYGMAPTQARRGSDAGEPHYRLALVDLAPRPVYQLPFADFSPAPSAAFDQLLARAAWTVWSQVEGGLDDAQSGACLERADGMATLRGLRAAALGGGRHVQIRWRGPDRPSSAELRQLAARAAGVRRYRAGPVPLPQRSRVHRAARPVGRLLPAAASGRVDAGHFRNPGNTTASVRRYLGAFTGGARLCPRARHTLPHLENAMLLDRFMLTAATLAALCACATPERAREGAGERSAGAACQVGTHSVPAVALRDGVQP